MTAFADLPKVEFKGPDSDDPFAYRWYDPGREVMGKPMREQLRWAVCYWHSFHWTGTDPFGLPTRDMAWMTGPVDADAAKAKMQAAFDFFEKLGAPYFCFHDVDAMADHAGPREYSSALSAALDGFEAHMARTGVKLLWGTANLTGHPRYAAGAATNPDPEVFAWAAHQVRSMLDATKRLGGENYVLWGGREGYDTLLNTDLRAELDQYGRFLSMVVEHKHKIGFDGPVLIEPKPFEPAKHMYDRDVSTVYAFLQRYDLLADVKVNIEANHATLAGVSFEHETALAHALGIFGSIDINRGDPQNGWDTDQFPNSVPELALALYPIFKAGGFATGGFNFDAKVRRISIEPEDLLAAHVGGLDCLARALLAVEAMLTDGGLETFIAERYAGWNTGLGAEILGGQHSMESLSSQVVQQDLSPRLRSGRQERLENYVNRFV